MDISKSLEDIHDAIITKYTVDFKLKKLEIYYENEKGKEFIIEFSDYLAHNFEHIIIENIIFDIEEITIEKFIINNKNFLDDNLKYGFPILLSHDKGINDLKEILERKQYKVFEISSSIGLNGFVIAKNLKILEWKMIQKEQEKSTDEYSTKRFIDLSKYITLKEEQTLEKLGIKIENKLCTEYEFDCIVMDAFFYRGERKRRESLGVSYREIKKIWDLLDKIEIEYKKNVAFS